MFQIMAEGVRFELTKPFRVYRISSAAHSTTLPPLRYDLNKVAHSTTLPTFHFGPSKLKMASEKNQSDWNRIWNEAVDSRGIGPRPPPCHGGVIPFYYEPEARNRWRNPICSSISSEGTGSVAALSPFVAIRCFCNYSIVNQEPP